MLISFPPLIFAGPTSFKPKKKLLPFAKLPNANPPNTIFSKSIKFAQRKPYRWPWRNESEIKDDLKPQFASQLSRHNTIASGAPPCGLFSFILLAFSIYFIAASDPLNYSVPNWNGIMKNTTGPRRAKEATNPPNRENWVTAQLLFRPNIFLTL